MILNTKKNIKKVKKQGGKSRAKTYKNLSHLNVAIFRGNLCRMVNNIFDK